MKDVRIELRVDAKTLKQWKRAAERAGRTLSDWIRYECGMRTFAQGKTYYFRDGSWTTKP